MKTEHKCTTCYTHFCSKFKSDKSQSKPLSLHFNGHFSRWTWISRFYWS